MAAGLIQSDPSIMMGKQVVVGTHIPAESILAKLATGETTDQLLETHPRSNKESIRAALSIAALSIASKDLRAEVVDPIAEHGT